MIRAAVATLTYLKAWESHPAVSDTHDLLFVIFHEVALAERSNSVEYRSYLRDESLVLYHPPLRRNSDAIHDVSHGLDTS